MTIYNCSNIDINAFPKWMQLDPAPKAAVEEEKNDAAQTVSHPFFPAFYSPDYLKNM